MHRAHASCSQTPTHKEPRVNQQGSEHNWGYADRQRKAEKCALGLAYVPVRASEVLGRVTGTSQYRNTITQ